MAAAGRKAALACIDIQQDFCDDPDGSLAVQGCRSLAPLFNELLSLPFPVKLATRDYHPADHISFASQHADKEPFTSKITVKNPENGQGDDFTSVLWPDHCIQGTPGCEFIPELDTSKLNYIIEKGQDKRVESYSGFGPPYRNPRISMTNMDDILKKEGVTDVFVVGVAYECCVKFTAIDAAEHGYRTYVIEDGTKAADKTPENLEATRKELEQKGVKIIGLDFPELDEIRKA